MEAPHDPLAPHKQQKIEGVPKWLDLTPATIQTGQKSEARLVKTLMDHINLILEISTEEFSLQMHTFTVPQHNREYCFLADSLHTAFVDAGF